MEILIALVIFVIGSISVWTLLSASISTYNHSIDELAIGLIAESVAAELQDAGVHKRKPLAAIAKRQSEHFPQYHYSVEYQQLATDAVFVTITIYYQRRGREYSESFHTVWSRTLAEADR